MRIGIVNDLPLAREALRRVVLSCPDHQVAWLAADGAEAVDRVRDDRPDLVLMDLIMPGVNGVEATRRIMAETPCPILVVTSTVTGNFRLVYDAMGAGALDAVDLPTLGPRGDVDGASVLLKKVATVGKLLGMAPPRDPTPVVPLHPTPAKHDGEPLFAIGSSTGGPNALAEVLGSLPKEFDAAVVIVQHVDAAFAPGLAQWLADHSGRRVTLATPGDRPSAGRVLLAGTNDHLIMDPEQRLRYTDQPRELSYRPSVDVFFKTLAAHWPGAGVAALLTGMGRDGAAGLLGLKKAGWTTIAQDEASSVIWGMPRAAVELRAATHVLPVSEIGAAVARLLSRG
jgi:two-component system, chemotaxis family, response regulator WspF